MVEREPVVTDAVQLERRFDAAMSGIYDEAARLGYKSPEPGMSTLARRLARHARTVVGVMSMDISLMIVGRRTRWHRWRRQSYSRPSN